MEYLEISSSCWQFSFGVFFLSHVVQRDRLGLTLTLYCYHCRAHSIFWNLQASVYETYNEGGQLLIVLAEAGGSVGVPLYFAVGDDKETVVAVIISQLAGCLVGLVTVVVVYQAVGSFTRYHLFVGSEVGYYSYCNGSVENYRRNSFVDGGCRCGLWGLFGRFRLWVLRVGLV